MKLTSPNKALAARLSRREVLARGGRTAAGLMLGGTPFGAPALIRSARAADLEKELVFAFAGGDTQRVFEQQIFPDFARKYGPKATYVPGQPADIVAKLQAQKGHSGIDVIFLTGAITYYTMDQGLLTELDRTRLGNLKLVDPSLDTEKFVAPIGLTADALVYNKDIVAKNGWQPPSDWLDLWDPKFKGHVGLSSINTTGSIAVLAQVAQQLSGNYKNLDPAFAKYRQLRPNVLDFFSSAGAWETAMQQGQLWIGTNSATRTMQLAANGYPIGATFPKSGIPGFVLAAGIVKGAPHPNAAYAWLDYLTSTEMQETLARLVAYIPANPRAKVPEELKFYFPAVKDLFIPDWRYLGAQLPSIVDRWNREVER